MEMVPIPIKMVTNMKVNLKKVKEMVRGPIYFIMVIIMKVCFWMESQMAVVFIPIRMVIYI